MKINFYDLPEGYTYSTVFASKVNPLVSPDKDKYLSLASQDKFKKFLPQNINFDEKVDFLGIAGESFIANKLNLNGDGVQTKEAIRIAELFPMSFVDASHDRNTVVGVILNASYTEVSTGKELTKDEVKDLKTPFSVTIGGIMWKAVNPELANIVEESSNASSKHKDTVYFSWELAFADYHLILIDKDKYNLEDGKIISDAAEISKIEKEMTITNGISLAKSGQKVGRIPVGEKLLPLGIGLVSNPAGQVQPITSNASIEETKAINNIVMNLDINSTEIAQGIRDIVIDTLKKAQEPGGLLAKKEICAHGHETVKCSCGDIISQCRCSSPDKKVTVIDNGCKKCKNNENNLSQSNSSVVNDNSNKKIFMKLTKIQDLTDDSIKECKAADVTNLYDSMIKEINDKWKSEVETKEKAAKASNDKAEELDKTQKDIQAKLDKLTEDYNKLVEENKKKEQVQVFSARMQTLEDQFDLNEDEKNLLAEDIKACVNDEDFTKFIKKQEVLLAAKKKAGKVFDPKTKKWVNKEDLKDGGKDDSQEDKDGNMKASLNDNSQKVLDDALKNADKDKIKVPNAGEADAPTLLERAKAAFGVEGWTTESKRKSRKE